MKKTETPFTEDDFSVRTYNCLKRAGIDTFEQVMQLTDDEMMEIEHLGRKSMEEIHLKVRQIKERENKTEHEEPSVSAMDCWHYIAPLIPVTSDHMSTDIYVRTFHAFKLLEEWEKENR